MRRVMKKDDHLYIYSMGKRFEVTAIFTDVDSANAYCNHHDNEGVIAEFAPFIFIAHFYEGERRP